MRNYQRDGPQCVDDNQGGAPNYYPNSFSGPQDQSDKVESTFKLTGDVGRYPTHDEDNFSQTGIFWRKVLTPETRARLVENIAGHLKDAQDFIQKRAVNNFAQANADFGQALRTALAQHAAPSANHSAHL
ncbi:catalase [Plakobranchus ocellatus]|uniref:Catalase n=1 Tax=Plakobranchus ocellatus TaxID=259542 RepID=A0AAV4A4T0_9GAST|nr:catalase [Plakobranchus ocellatus]